MRFIVFSALLLSAVALSAAVQSLYRPQQGLRFASGQTYVYRYESRLLSGVPQLANQFAGLDIEADIYLQSASDATVQMRILDIQVGKHNGPLDAEGQAVIDHQLNAAFERELTKPARFVYTDGKVRAFETDASEPEWSVNMKKAILSLLNVDLMPKKIIKSAQQMNQIPRPDLDLTVYPVYEDGIGGVCETVYQISNQADPQNPESEKAFVLNVTKTRNYDNCLTEPSIVNDNYDVRGCPWVCRKQKSFSAVQGYFPTPDAVTDPYQSGCPCGQEPQDSPVDAFAFVKYNISLLNNAPVIESAFADSKIAYKTNGDELLVIAQQNLTLIGQTKAPIAQMAIARPVRHQELSFRLPKPELPHGFKLPLDIPYYHLFGAPDAQQLIQLVPELLESLAEDIVAGDIAASKDSMQKSVQMVNALAVLPEPELNQLFETVARKGQSLRATPKEQVIRKLFLDALPLAGSNQAALFIKELILKDKVTTFEAKEMVEAVPQNLFLIDTQTMDAYLELFQSDKVQKRRHLASSTGIAFGKMVKEACVKRQSTPGDIPDGEPVPHAKRNQPAMSVIAGAQSPQRVTISQKTSISPRMKRSAEWEAAFTQDVCSEADVDKYVQIIGRLLDSAPTFHQKVTLIETLAHMAVPQVLPLLEPYISGSIPASKCPGYVTEKKSEAAEECQFLRQIVIYSLFHVTEYYPKQVVPLVLPVYSDVSAPYEVRIAAFTTLVFAAPEKHVLERIAAELYRENNRQIRSFVYSSLQTIGNITLPCFHKTAQSAAQAFEHSPNADYGYQYSKMIGHSFYDPKKDFGMYATAEWVANNVSQVPRSAYVSVGQSSGPFKDDVFQLGFNAKGMEQLLERALEPNGIVSDAFESMHAKTKDRRIAKRNADSAQQAIEALKSKLNLEMRSDDEPKAAVFFKLFDRTSYYALDKHYIHQLIDGMEDSIKDIAQALLQGQSYHYVKLVMPSQLYKVLPSELGLPVVITHRHPTIVSIKVDQAKLQIESAPKTVYPIGANLTAQIQPSIFYSSYAFAFAVNSADRQAFGAHVEKTTQVTLPVEISIGYSRPKNLLTWSVIPKVATEVLYHETQSSTFIAKASIAGAPDRDWLQDSKPIKSMAAPFKHEKTIGHETLGLGLRFQLNTENPWAQESLYSTQTAKEHGIVAAAIEAWRNAGLAPRELHVQIESDAEEPISGYDFTLRYKWIEDAEEGKDSDDSDESSASSESDSDESDASSASHSSESKSSKSSESSESSKSSKSSKSSEESNESKSLKQRIRQRMAKTTKSGEKRSKRSINGKESNESSDESSNESGSKSWSKSGSKESSQSSSSESKSSEEKNRSKGKNGSKSAQSSESSSSSSDASDESHSFEDNVFGYEDVMKLILGQDFKRRDIKRIAKQLIRKTQHIWQNNWDEDYDSSSEDKSDQNEDTEVPQTIAHDFKITAVARGPRPTYYAANILYAHTFDHRIVWFKTDGHIKAPKGVYMQVPTLFCADAVVSYPTIPNEFYYEPTQLQSQKAKLQAQAGWGAQCQTEGGVIVAGVLESVEDRVITQDDLAVQDGSSPAHVQSWFFRQCAIDRSEGKSQSYACERAVIDHSYFNQLVVDLKYKNVPKAVQNYTQKAALALKVALYSHMDTDSVDVHNPEHQIRVVAQYSSRVPDLSLANLYIDTPEESTRFERIHVPHVRPVSALMPIKEIYENLIQGYDATDKCVLMEDFVRTFDNVTFKTPASQCQYLLAKDCSPKERFAVFAQTLDFAAKTKTLSVLIGGSEIKLLPPQQQNIAQAVIDGHTHEITYRKALHSAANDVRIYLRATPSDAFNPIIVLESDLNDLTIKYDGKNAKVEIGGQYQGKTCGLCGDNNDESEDEFQGPDLCLYDNALDFANAYALSGQHCEQTPIPKGPKRCPYNSKDSSEETLSTHKQIKHVIGADGQKTTIIRQETDAMTGAERSQTIQSQANAEEVLRTQQQLQEQQQARQDGQPLSEGQKEALIAATPDQQKMIQRLRTQYIARDDMICFTTRPVMTCINARATRTKQMKVDFHCLPKSSPFTQQLIQESAKQVIKQLVNKRVDLRQTLEVPIACQ